MHLLSISTSQHSLVGRCEEYKLCDFITRQMTEEIALSHDYRTLSHSTEYCCKVVAIAWNIDS